jgi:hypothetical protein
MRVCAGPMRVTIVPTVDFLVDPSLAPEFAEAFKQFPARIASGDRPMCLLCDHTWHDFSSLPEAMAVVHTEKFFRKPGDDIATITSGICTSCWRTEESHKEILARCLERFRQLWDFRVVSINPAPSMAQ